MSLIDGFNANEVEPQSGFEPIPAGEYEAVITRSEEKTTRNGLGQFLQLEFEIVGGDYNGRKLWTNLNLQNPNARTVEFARTELSAICRAVNVLQPKDPADLYNIPLIISVKQKMNESTGEMGNAIKGYRDKGSAPKNPVAPTASAQQKAPWAR